MKELNLEKFAKSNMMKLLKKKNGQNANLGTVVCNLACEMLKQEDPDPTYMFAINHLQAYQQDPKINTLGDISEKYPKNDPDIYCVNPALTDPSFFKY